MKLLTILLGISVLMSSCKSNEETEKPIKVETKKISKSILDYAEKYNAIVGWDTLRIFSTVQLAALVVNEKRPILIDNKLLRFKDIYYANESYNLVFSLRYKYYFYLECNNSQKDEILNRVRGGMFFNLIAIAEIQNVKKINYIIEAELTEVNSDNIELNLGHSNSYIIKGKLIDILKN